MTVAVIGLGKAGLPLAAVIADSGLDVIGVDIDKKRVALLQNGENPIIEEPSLGSLLKKYNGKNLKFTSSYADAKDCEAYIIIVPLFIENNLPDFSILTNAFKEVSKLLTNEDLVVLETTVPPGSTEKVLAPILQESDKNFHLAYSPERIMTGYSISRYKEFPKVIGGADKKSSDIAKKLYSEFCKAVKVVSDIKTAEFVKVSEGVYRDVNIALANELFKISNDLELDYYEVMRNANHDFCHLHRPGNVGGHCIPVYPWFLMNSHETNLIRSARMLNDDMIRYYADLIPVKSGKIAVLGLTYRDDVKEIAYSRSLPLIRLLESRGYKVYANDPLLSRQEIKDLGLVYSDDFDSMDSIVLMNKCVEYHSRLKKLKNIVDVQAALH